MYRRFYVFDVTIKVFPAAVNFHGVPKVPQ